MRVEQTTVTAGPPIYRIPTLVSFNFPAAQQEMRRASGGGGKSPRLLIVVDVMGSPGPFKFLVNDGDPVSTVIATTLRNYSKEGRIPALSTNVDDFLLYSTGGCGTNGQ